MAFFGRSVTSLGDLDGDGVSDMAIGAYGDDTGGTNRGAVYVLFLKPPTPGDFDTDGDVDGVDLGIWETSYGRDDGADADGDGDSDGADFLIWQSNFSPPPLLGVVDSDGEVDQAVLTFSETSFGPDNATAADYDAEKCLDWDGAPPPATSETEQTATTVNGVTLDVLLVDSNKSIDAVSTVAASATLNAVGGLPDSLARRRSSKSPGWAGESRSQADLTVDNTRNKYFEQLDDPGQLKYLRFGDIAVSRPTADESIAPGERLDDFVWSELGEQLPCRYFS